METRELTFGEKACGVSFNPDGRPDVGSIKLQFAALVDDLNMRCNAAENNEIKRMLRIAITEVQTAQMWAVKAVTWQY